MAPDTVTWLGSIGVTVRRRGGHAVGRRRHLHGVDVELAPLRVEEVEVDVVGAGRGRLDGGVHGALRDGHRGVVGLGHRHPGRRLVDEAGRDRQHGAHHRNLGPQRAGEGAIVRSTSGTRW